MELARRQDPSKGFDPNVEQVARLFAPHLANGVRLIGSFGGANVDSAVAAAVKGIRSSGGESVRIAAIHGDDVRKEMFRYDIEVPSYRCTANDLGDTLIDARAYIGAEPISEALDRGAQLVIGGRLCDASLGVGAICNALDWAPDDWDGIALGTLVGHLLTGGCALTGGGFADPPYRTVPGLDDLGFPMAQVSPGEFTIAKLPGTGGMVHTDIVKCRIAYEVHDPTAYETPDVTADFSQVEVEQLGPDEVRVRGMKGRPRPSSLLVLVAVDKGWIGCGEISFGGPGCLDRARLAEDIVRKRLGPLMVEIDAVRFDYIGFSSLFGDNFVVQGPPADVRLRVAARTRSRDVADAVVDICGYLGWGPAGGGGPLREVRKAIDTVEAFLPRELVHLETEVVTA
jgi:hypothetical protein